LSSDLDEEKRKRISLLSRSEVEMIEQQHLYSKWLVKSRETDLADIARLGMIYVSGNYVTTCFGLDHGSRLLGVTETTCKILPLLLKRSIGKDPFGRPIVVVVGSKLPSKINAMVLDKIFTYFIKIMDPIVNKDYVCIIFWIFFGSYLESFPRCFVPAVIDGV
jgi:hypothetical protein